MIELDAADTHELRRLVLRDGTESDHVVFDGDDLASTFHLGVRRDGRVVAISTWLVRRYPDLPARPAHQLRGMATDPAVRCQGLGDELLQAGLARCAAAGSTVVWARARTAALGFYTRHGFATRGSEYVDLATGLPHHDIVRRVSFPSSPG